MTGLPPSELRPSELCPAVLCFRAQHSMRGTPGRRRDGAAPARPPTRPPALRLLWPRLARNRPQASAGAESAHRSRSAFPHPPARPRARPPPPVCNPTGAGRHPRGPARGARPPGGPVLARRARLPRRRHAPRPHHPQPRLLAASAGRARQVGGGNNNFLGGQVEGAKATFWVTWPSALPRSLSSAVLPSSRLSSIRLTVSSSGQISRG